MSLRKAHLSVGSTLISSRGSVLALLALQCYSSSDSLAASFSLQYPRCIPLAMSFALCGVLCVLPLTVSSHRSYKSPVESGSKASFTASYLSVLAFSATHENMIALNRFLILGLSLFLFIVHALADPELDTVEEQIYRRANRSYQSKYLELPANGVRGVPSFAHLSVVHPVEQGALNLAQSTPPGPTSQTGPFFYERGPKALYVSTRVPANSLLGRSWGLAFGQHRHDGHAFWRIDGNGPKLLRFDRWREGAHTPQEFTMAEAISEAMHLYPQRMIF